MGEVVGLLFEEEVGKCDIGVVLHFEEVEDGKM